MLTKIDNTIINKLDALTTNLQRKGILLTNLHVLAAEATLVSHLAAASTLSSPTFALIFSGIFWGGYVVFYRIWANQYKDYPESKRMMDKLNAEAVYYRTYQAALRKAWLVLYVVLLISNITATIFVDYNVINCILSSIASTCLTIMYSMNACLFIGPGEFAKDRQESLTGNTVTSNG